MSLQGLREQSDYDAAAIFTEAMAREAFEEAEGFCQVAQSLLATE